MSEVAAFPEERTAIVSGAGAPRGIARAVARRLLKDNWNVVVCDVVPEVLDFGPELAEEFPDRKVLALQFSIADEDQVKEAFAKIDEEMPPLVGMANVAGVACPVALEDITVEEFERVMGINCTGTMLMMKYGSELMKKVGVGRIVNFSSITALDGGGTFSKFAYAAAKAAVIGLTRGGARELGQSDITCNVILPGPVDTDIMGGKLTDERKAMMSSNIPLRRVGQPQDLAAVVNFLLSEEAAFVNGVSINVDGGKHMH